MKPAIRIENLSKQYRLGLVGTDTLNHDLKHWWYLMRGKEDPYLKIGKTNDSVTGVFAMLSHRKHCTEIEFSRNRFSLNLNLDLNLNLN